MMIQNTHLLSLSLRPYNLSGHLIIFKNLLNLPIFPKSSISWTYFFFVNFILLYNTVLVSPYIDMNLPRVYMSSQSWTPPPTSLPMSSLWGHPLIPFSCAFSVLQAQLYQILLSVWSHLPISFRNPPLFLSATGTLPRFLALPWIHSYF